MTVSQDGHLEPFADHIYQPVQQATEEDTMPASTAHHNRSTMDPSTLRYLTKVQVLTPLTILLNVASLAVCSILVKPNLGDINHEYLTQFTPNPAFILSFWAVLFLLQIGFAILLVLGQKDFTKVCLSFTRSDCMLTSAHLPPADTCQWCWNALGIGQHLPGRVGHYMGRK
jgi:hypothetical protein